MKIAYIMSRFPKITETFILYEMIEMEKLGHRISLYPLLREKQPVAHPEVGPFLRRARFQPFISLPILRANRHYLFTSPGRYLRMIFEVLRGTFGSLNFFFGALGILPKAVKFALDMQKEGVEHVHAHFCTHPAVAALIIHRLTGIPFSFTAHGSDLHVERRMLCRKIAAAAFAVTISDFNKKVMVEECHGAYAEKIHVVHCGIDPDYFVPKEAIDRDGPLKIICVASLEEVKGHRYLIEACRKLRDHDLPFQCDFVGDGPLREKIVAQIKEHSLETQVVLRGMQPRQQVMNMMRAADVKVLASVPTAQGKREGIPVVLMEAMAVGLPVISTRLSGIPELVQDGDTGILVEPGDSDGLAAALQKLAGNARLRRHMGLQGRELILRAFHLHKNTGRLAQLIASTGRTPAAQQHEVADCPT